LSGLGLRAVHPRAQFLGAEDVVQAQHPLEMLHGRELRRESGAADQLRGRVRHPQVRVLLLQIVQFVQQCVERGVGDGRRVLDVVAELVLAHLLGELAPACAGLTGRGGLPGAGIGLNVAIGHRLRLTPERPGSGAAAADSLERFDTVRSHGGSVTSLADQDGPPSGPAPASHAAPPRRKAGLALSGTALTVLLMAASAPSPFYPRMQERFGLSPVGITLVFAVYAVALLATLLTVGSLSDHIGRRPVITVGFVVLAGGMVLLWTAQSSFGLFAGRAVQGLASGFLLSALSASISDFAAPERPLHAALLNAVAPMAGLASGALFAGVALEVSPHADAVVFGTLAAVYCVVAGAVRLVPETSAHVDGWRRSLVPRMSVP